MKTLSKYDVLFYLSQMENKDAGKTGRKRLMRYLRRNIFFENVSDRTVSEILRVLKRDKYIVDMGINRENVKVSDCLAFLYWARMKGVDYNEVLDEKAILVFKKLFENNSMELELKDVVKKTGFSRQTAIKYVHVLTASNFVRVLKKKPLLLRANLNDLTFFYVNFMDFRMDGFEREVNVSRLLKIHLKKLVNASVMLHVYSTTVTEGNTATEDDVAQIFGDFPVKLTPREVTEILNARRAIDELFSMCEEDISVSDIKYMHGIMMNNILDKSGEFYYGSKRIAGFKTKLPSSSDEIEFAIAALVNFSRKRMNAQVLGAIVHFIFVSIHPFADGNGRIGRLLHSWVLLKAGLPLFAFDPHKRNEYFVCLEYGRSESMEEFVNFCIKEHMSSLERLVRN